jgi:hypothetical protein
MTHNPFAKILRPYFDLLSTEFDHLANESVKHGIDADEVARQFLRDTKLREGFNKFIVSHISAKIIDFWNKNNRIVRSELTKLPGLKAKFGGDIGPQNRDQLFQRLGVYYDSIIVSDPLLRTVTTQYPQKWEDYYLIKYGINLVLNRDIYLADVYPPIAVLLGEEHLLSTASIIKQFRVLKKHSVFDALAISNAMFGQTLDSEKDALEFFKRFYNFTELVKEVADPELFLFVGESGLEPLEQIEAVEKELRIHMREEDIPSQMKGPQLIWSSIHSRMMQANLLLEQCIDMGAHRVIQAPVSFHWLSTKVTVTAKIMSAAIEEDLSAQLPLTNALISKRLEWLSNIPVDSLIHLRKQGFLSDLRSIITGNFAMLSKAEIDNLSLIANQVDLNLEVAFNRHQEQIRALNKALIDDLKLKIPTALISVAAAIQPLTGGSLPSWLSAIATMGGTATLSQLFQPPLKLFERRNTCLERRLGSSGMLRKKHKRRTSLLLVQNEPCKPVLFRRERSMRSSVQIFIAGSRAYVKRPAENHAAFSRI